MPIFENYFYLIYGASFIGAIISASLGFLGGTMLLAVMAQIFQMEVLIPLHAIIQLSSNATRAFVLRKNIDWKIGREAIIGALLGGVVGCFYLTPLPENWFNFLLGLFIILITISPKFSANFYFRGKWFVVGFISCSIGLFVGAIGTLVGSLLLAEKLEKKPMVSTQAVMQSAIHLAKIIVFFFLGFSLATWSLLILGSVIAAYLGTLMGAKLLDLISEKTFRLIATTLVLMLALRLILVGALGIF